MNMFSEKPSILLIDDNMSMQILIGEVLHPFDVISRTSYQRLEIVNLLQTHHSLLLVIITIKPSWYEYEVMELCRIIKFIKPDIPLCALSAIFDRDLICSCISSGFQHCISVPFDVDAFNIYMSEIIETNKK